MPQGTFEPTATQILLDNYIYQEKVMSTKARKSSLSASMAYTPMDGLTFGCDPELFILNNDTGKFVCAEGLIPGTKLEPYPVKDGAVQVDGMAAEFNIDPVNTFEDFDSKITSVMDQLTKMLPPNHTLVQKSAVVFDEDVWNDAPMKAKELGCTPDFNAWTGEVNPPPKCDNKRLRTASGHIHIGWTKDADMTDIQHITACRDLVRQLDYYLGAWSVTQDSDPTRRLLYGKAGAMRFKPYGVEYRVLSNFWLQDSSTRLAVWNRLQKGIWDMGKVFRPQQGEFVPKGSSFSCNELVIKSINTSLIDSDVADSFYTPIFAI